MIESTKIFDNLRKKGHRITPQREQILNIFHKIPDGDHLSADELQLLLQNHNIKISLATLYRTLKFLVIHGLLRELDFGEDHKHYELNSSGKMHHHLICNYCGITIEFDDEKLINYAKTVVADKNNFLAIDYQFKIFGLCKNCRHLADI